MKMAEQNLREMMIDDIQEDDEEESQIVEQSVTKIEWYLIDTDRNFCKVWNFLITCITIYNLLVTPMILVFPDIYQTCVVDPASSPPEQPAAPAEDPALPADPADPGRRLLLGDLPEKDCSNGSYQSTTNTQKQLLNIELVIDIIYFVEILFCFVKKTIAKKDLPTIAGAYLSGYFIFDAVSTIPNLMVFNEGL